MDVFLMIRRKKTTIFTDAKESSSVSDVKKMIEGILKVAPENQRLFKEDDTAMTDDNKTLQDYGYTSTTARAQAPATISLVFRADDGEWEPLDITPLSIPPELPDCMKPQDSKSEQDKKEAETNNA